MAGRCYIHPKKEHMVGPPHPNNHDALGVPVPEIVHLLVAIIGRRLTAFIGSSPEEAIDGWLTDLQPDRDTEMRLRLCHRIVVLLANFATAQIIRTWLLASNLELKNAAPITLLRDGDIQVDGAQMLAAATAFAAGGWALSLTRTVPKDTPYE